MTVVRLLRHACAGIGVVVRFSCAGSEFLSCGICPTEKAGSSAGCMSPLLLLARTIVRIAIAIAIAIATATATAATMELGAGWGGFFYKHCGFFTLESCFHLCVETCMWWGFSNTCGGVSGGLVIV